MQRGVLIVAIVIIIGTIAYQVSQTGAAPTGAPGQASATPQAAAAAPVVEVPFGPTIADAGPASSISGPGEWLMEGSNPGRTRLTAAPLTLPLSQRREIGIPGDVAENGSPPVIAHGMLLIETADHLRAFDLSTGQQRWIYAEQGSYISPAVAGDRVFIRAESGNKGHVIALDLQTGQQLWTFAPRKLSDAGSGYYGGHLTSPVVVDGVVYIAGGNEVYALDATNGQPRWTFVSQDLITSSVTIGEDQIYISDFRYIYALDQQLGTLLWATPVESSFSFSAVTTGELVLIPDGAKLIALDTASGQQRWEMSVPGETLIPAAADETRAYVKSTGTIYALDLASGREIWRYRDANFISLPVISSGHVFVVSGLEANTRLAALDVVSGVRIWEQPVRKLATTAPIVAGRAIYVRTTDGRIVAFSS